MNTTHEAATRQIDCPVLKRVKRSKQNGRTCKRFYQEAVHKMRGSFAPRSLTQRRRKQRQRQNAWSVTTSYTPVQEAKIPLAEATTNHTPQQLKPSPTSLQRQPRNSSRRVSIYTPLAGWVDPSRLASSPLLLLLLLHPGRHQVRRRRAKRTRNARAPPSAIRHVQFRLVPKFNKGYKV